MKNLKWALPVAIVFCTPWAHRLAYENILLAIPSIESYGAHWFAGLISFCALAFSWIYWRAME